MKFSIYQHGHEIGNHYYSHPNFKYLNTTDTIYEIKKTQEVIYDITQHYPIYKSSFNFLECGFTRLVFTKKMIL